MLMDQLGGDLKAALGTKLWRLLCGRIAGLVGLHLIWLTADLAFQPVACHFTGQLLGVDMLSLPGQLAHIAGIIAFGGKLMFLLTPDLAAEYALLPMDLLVLLPHSPEHMAGIGLLGTDLTF